MKLATLDLETSPILADVWGIWDQNVGLNQLKVPTRVISMAAKWLHKKSVMFKSEYHNSPEEMVQWTHDLLDEADVVVHYNGIKFDMKHLRREWALAGLTPPSPVKQIDLLTVAKTFSFPSYKLDYVAGALGLGHKVTHQGHELWRECLDPEMDEATRRRAWAKMRTYNKGDVSLTEKVYLKLRPWIKNHPHLSLFLDDGLDHCQRCGGIALEKRGFAYTPLSVFQQYRCKDCGAWSRGKKALRTIDVRGVQ